MKLSSLAERRVQHICVFGDPKSGKSTLAAQLAEVGMKLVWISIDNGHSVLYKLSPEAQENVIEVIPIPDTKDSPIAIHTCMKLVDGRPVNLCDEHSIVECAACKKDNKTFTRICLNETDADTVVIWDNISQLAESAIANIAIRSAKEKKEDPDDYKFTYDEWRLLGGIMGKFLNAIQQAQYNTVCIAHPVETEMDDGTVRLVPLVGTVPFSRTAGKYFDHIVHCGVTFGGHKFGSSTVYKHSVLTGSRSDVAIEKEKTPSLLQFFKRDNQPKTNSTEITDTTATIPTVKPPTSLLASFKKKP